MKQFTKARRGAIPLRIALMGMSGQGKTYTALAVALHLADQLEIPHEQVGVIDSEVLEGPEGLVSRAEMYVGERCRCSDCQGQGIAFGEFAVLRLPSSERAPRDYCEALAAARGAGFKIVVCDSISHEWEGVLDIAGGKFTGWKEATAAHDEFMSTVMGYPGHVVCTMRLKEKHSQGRDEKTGRQVVQSHGLQPIQRAGVEYEFDVCLFLDGAGAQAEVVKTRSSRLRELRSFSAPGARLAGELLAWSRGPGAAAEREAGEAEAKKVREVTPPAEEAPKPDAGLGLKALLQAFDELEAVSPERARKARAALADHAPSDALPMVLKAIAGEKAKAEEAKRQEPSPGAPDPAEMHRLSDQLAGLCGELEAAGKGKVAEEWWTYAANAPNDMAKLQRAVRKAEAALGEVQADQGDPDPEPEAKRSRPRPRARGGAA